MQTDRPVFSEDEQQKRLHIVELLLPSFGADRIDDLLKAANAVQAHVSGQARPSPDGTADKA
jgi:hypothetical protein